MMETHVTMIEGTCRVSTNPSIKAINPPWIMVADPERSSSQYLGQVMKRKQIALPVVEHNPDDRFEIGFVTNHHHDGLLLYTNLALSAVSQAAEKIAAERGGDWEVSPAYLMQEYVGMMTHERTLLMMRRRT